MSGGRVRARLLAVTVTVTVTGLAVADEAPRRLTLADAVELALRQEPTVAQAHIAQDRGKLGVLRAQLDRISVRVDGSLQELWKKENIGGSPRCSVSSLIPDEATCAAAG